MARKLKNTENEKHPLDDLKNDDSKMYVPDGYSFFLDLEHFKIRSVSLSVII